MKEQTTRIKEDAEKTKIAVSTACGIVLLFAYIFSSSFYLQLLIFALILFVEQNVLKDGFFALCAFAPNVKSLVALSALFSTLHGVSSFETHNLFFYVAVSLVLLNFFDRLCNKSFLISQAQHTVSDKISTLTIALAICIAIICVIINFVNRIPFSNSVVRIFATLTVACSPTVALISPIFSLVTAQTMAKHGIAVNNLNTPEKLGGIKELIVEQRGIVTEHEYKLYDIYSVDNDKYRLLSIAFAIEANFHHPVSSAVISAAYSADLKRLPAENCYEISGKGIGGVVDGDKYLIGTKRLFREKRIIFPDTVNKTYFGSCMPLYVAKNGEFYGVLLFVCKMKDGSADVLNKIGALGIRRMILADGEREDLKKCSDILITEKEKVLQELKNGAKIKAMTVTEKSLIKADVCATAYNTSADVVLGDNAMYGVLCTLLFGKTALACIKAASVMVMLVSLAFALFTALSGAYLPFLCLLFGILPLSYFAVIQKTVPPQITVTEEEEMFKKANYTININGMSCTHCSARVKTALESLRGVSAEVSLEEKNARVKCPASMSAETLAKAVSDVGFTVVSVERV